MVNGRRRGSDGEPLVEASDRALVLHALAQLPSGQRAVIRRSYYLGWSLSQIATDLGVSECVVMSMLHNGLRSLRQMARPMAPREPHPDQRTTPDAAPTDAQRGRC
jgi:DNA-directed RNA polymerase specialized sigma24 family protein